MKPWAYIATFKTLEGANEAGNRILADFERNGTRYMSKFSYLSVMKTLAQGVARRYGQTTKSSNIVTKYPVTRYPIKVSRGPNNKYTASITSHKMRKRILQSGEYYFFDEYTSHDDAYIATAKLIQRVCG